jgi:hypothetical protein
VLRDRFIFVTAETGILRLRKDAEGDFLRSTLGPDFFPTAAGYMACISASGKNLGNDPKKALMSFARLPEAERTPGAVTVPPLAPVDDAVAVPPPPPNGLVLKAYGRFLSREPEGGLRRATMKDFPQLAGLGNREVDQVGFLFEAHPDFVWFTEREWQALIPGEPKVGATLAMPKTLVQRLCRFHLFPPHLYGESNGWHPSSIRAAELTLTVESVSDSGVKLRLSGFAKLGTVFEAEKATSPNGPLGLGFEPQLDGVLEYDRVKNGITRLELVALGDCWGRLGDANGRSAAVERPGRHPIGYAFEVVDPAVSANRVVPAGRADHVQAGGDYWR